jgi:hypothetical protein
LKRLSKFAVLRLPLTMPRSFAGPPTYSFSIVTQTGSAIGGYTVGSLSHVGNYAVLNDSRQVIFWFQTPEPCQDGVASQNAVVALKSQFVSPAYLRSFFLDNAGNVYIDGGGGVYARPADGRAPLSLLFSYTAMLGVPWNDSGVPATRAFGVDDVIGVGLAQGSTSGSYIGTQDGVVAGPYQSIDSAVISRNGQIAYLDANGVLRTSGGLIIGPGSIPGGATIGTLTGVRGTYGVPVGINNSGQVAFAATYGAGQAGIFTNNGLAIAPVPGCNSRLCNLSRVNINDNGLIAYTGIAAFPSPYFSSTYVATQYGYVARPSDKMFGKTVASAYNLSDYFLNNHNDLVFVAGFTDRTQAVVLATDTRLQRSRLPPTSTMPPASMGRERVASGGEAVSLPYHAHLRLRSIWANRWASGFGLAPSRRGESLRTLSFLTLLIGW